MKKFQIWKNLEFLYMYTVGPQCKNFLIMVLQEETHGCQNDCILVGINEN